MTKKGYWALGLFGICLFFLIAHACKKKENRNENNDKPLIYLEYAGKSVQIEDGAGIATKPIVKSSDIFQYDITYQFKGEEKKIQYYWEVQH